MPLFDCEGNPCSRPTLLCWLLKDDLTCCSVMFWVPWLSPYYQMGQQSLSICVIYDSPCSKLYLHMIKNNHIPQGSIRVQHCMERNRICKQNYPHHLVWNEKKINDQCVLFDWEEWANVSFLNVAHKVCVLPVWFCFQSHSTTANKKFLQNQWLFGLGFKKTPIDWVNFMDLLIVWK